MINKIHITGNIAETEEQDTANQLDYLLTDINNPALVYSGNEETAAKVKAYAEYNKIPFYEYTGKRNDHINAMTTAYALIAIGSMNSTALAAYKARLAYTYLAERTRNIHPQKTQPAKKRHALPPARKAKRSRRNRRHAQK